MLSVADGNNEGGKDGGGIEERKWEQKKEREARTFLITSFGSVFPDFKHAYFFHIFRLLLLLFILFVIFLLQCIYQLIDHKSEIIVCLLVMLAIRFVHLQMSPLLISTKIEPGDRKARYLHHYVIA